MTEIPLYGSPEARTASVVRCRRGHLASREAFEAVGCPYCNLTQGERNAYLRGVEDGRRKAREAIK